MKELKIVKSRFDCQWGYQLEEGKILVICDKDGKCQLMWDTPFSIESGIIFKNEDEVDAFHKGRTLTLNILYANKIGKEVHNYDEFRIRVGEVKSLTNKGVKEICKEFKEHGFNVTEHAVLTNFANWQSGYKCGYRDDANGYHLFTPCGLNPFSLTATTLVDGVDWQKTYLC
jgi:hypothetical protein